MSISDKVVEDAPSVWAFATYVGDLNKVQGLIWHNPGHCGHLRVNQQMKDQSLLCVYVCSFPRLFLSLCLPVTVSSIKKHASVINRTRINTHK